MKKLLHSTPFLIFMAVIFILYFTLKHSPSKYENELSSAELTLVSGDDLDLKQFSGQVYILHFFASWCEVCKEDFQYLDELHNRLHLPIIGVAMNDDVNKLYLLNKSNSPYDYIALDIDHKIAKLIRSNAIPETIVIGKDGKILWRYLGGFNKETMLGLMKYIKPLI